MSTVFYCDVSKLKFNTLKRVKGRNFCEKKSKSVESGNGYSDMCFFISRVFK